MYDNTWRRKSTNSQPRITNFFFWKRNLFFFCENIWWANDLIGLSDSFTNLKVWILLVNILQFYEILCNIWGLFFVDLEFKILKNYLMSRSIMKFIPHTQVRITAFFNFIYLWGVEANVDSLARSVTWNFEVFHVLCISSWQNFMIERKKYIEVRLEI